MGLWYTTEVSSREERPSLDHRHFSHEKNAFRIMNLPLKLMVEGTAVLIVFHISIHSATRAKRASLSIWHIWSIPFSGLRSAREREREERERVRFINDGN